MSDSKAIVGSCCLETAPSQSDADRAMDSKPSQDDWGYTVAEPESKMENPAVV
jgi:hypothetical protein